MATEMRVLVSIDEQSEGGGSAFNVARPWLRNASARWNVLIEDRRSGLIRSRLMLGLMVSARLSKRPRLKRQSAEVAVGFLPRSAGAAGPSWGHGPGSDEFLNAVPHAVRAIPVARATMERPLRAKACASAGCIWRVTLAEGGPTTWHLFRISAAGSRWGRMVTCPVISAGSRRGCAGARRAACSQARRMPRR